MKKFLTIIILSTLVFGKITAQDVQTEFLWYDYTLPMEDRIEALVDAMTLEEKVMQMMDEAPAIPRLDVPQYGWWNECLQPFLMRRGRNLISRLTIITDQNMRVLLSGHLT